jgi:hypothetical protein
MVESSMMTWMSSNVNIVIDTTMRAKYLIAIEAAKELGGGDRRCRRRRRALQAAGGAGGARLGGGRRRGGHRRG